MDPYYISQSCVLARLRDQRLLPSATSSSGRLDRRSARWILADNLRLIPLPDSLLAMRESSSCGLRCDGDQWSTAVAVPLGRGAERKRGHIRRPKNWRLGSYVVP